MRSSSQLFKDAFALVKANLTLFVGIALWPMIITYVAVLFEPAENTGVVNTTEWAVYGVLMLLVMISSVLMSAALIMAVNNPAMGVGEAYKAALRFFWSYIGLSILMSLIIMVGFLLLIVPGIILSVWFAFASYILILENAGITDSLRRSREYVRGRWWGVFGRLILVSIVAFAITVAGAMIFSFIPSEAISGLLETAVSLVLVPFMMAFVYLMYKDVKGGAAPAVPAL